MRTFFVRTGPHIAIAAIICLAFFLRFIAYDHPLGLKGGEGYRDYLTAKHIVVFHDFPAAGPWNGTLPHIGNSPLYFYALAVPLLISTSPQMLEIAFIVLSCIGIYLLYLLGRDIFGTRTAILAALLYAVAPEMIRETSSFVWQPYCMEPLLIGSAYTLYRAYVGGRYSYLIASIVLGMSALAMHMSALAVAPLFGAAILYTAFVHHRAHGVRIATAVAVGYSFLIFLLPRLFAEPIFAGTETPARTSGHLIELIKNLFVRLIPQENPNLTDSLLTITALVFVSATGLYLYSKTASLKKYVLLGLISVVFLQCIVAAAFGTPVDSRFILPATFALALTASALLVFLLDHLPFPNIVLTLPVAGIICASISSPFIAAALQKYPLADRPREAIAAQALDAAAADIRMIREGDAYMDYSFFSVIGFRSGNLVLVPDMLWDGLEERLGARLVHLSGNSGGLIGATNGPYMLVLCADGERVTEHYEPRDCLSRPELEQYEVLKPSYEDPDLNVFLMIRKDLVHSSERP